MKGFTCVRFGEVVALSMIKKECNHFQTAFNRSSGLFLKKRDLVHARRSSFVMHKLIMGIY